MTKGYKTKDKNLAQISANAPILHIFRKFHAKDPGKICRIYQFIREKYHVILFATELLVFRRKN